MKLNYNDQFAKKITKLFIHNNTKPLQLNLLIPVMIINKTNNVTSAI